LRELGNDPVGIERFAQSLEKTGYEYVLGADEDRVESLQGPYRLQHPFHEPFVLVGYLAASTTRLGFVTNGLVRPQRQTILVAKQAAEVDVLNGGHLRPQPVKPGYRAPLS
jgi:alkanesulfonate monooxygenase SsuD/methylene tetrahydromethanopterin reductase-like flavin-dependent oxidoreductase (luciferase family)